MIQAGITKNWFGMGNTSFYGEYGRADGLHQERSGEQTLVKKIAPNVWPSPLPVPRPTFWGIGVVQQIDAAAMELYLGWRRYETDISGTGNLTTGLPGWFGRT